MKLSDYLSVLRRRFGIVLAAAVLVPVIAVLIALSRHDEYTATATVLLNRQGVATAVGESATDPLATIAQGTQFTQTQASLAGVRPLLDRTIAAVKPPQDVADAFRNGGSVTPKRGTDLLDFNVTVGDRVWAGRLANAWAQQFIAYRNEIDRRPLEAAAASARRQLNAQGGSNDPLARQLQTSLNNVESLIALQGRNVTLVRPSGDGYKTAPRPLLALILGLVLGIALGVALAFIRQATDTRLRSSDEVSDTLDVPVLGQVPSPDEPADALVLRDATGVAAEAHRLLGLSLRLANVDAKARVLLCTSALPQEGRSTTVANLAITLARAGHAVALVDLDLRRPSQGRLFGIQGPGVTDVALGSRDLDDALVGIDVAMPGEAAGGAHGSLAVLPSGPVPPSPSQFVASEGVRTMLRRLAERHEFVLVDGPPLLGRSDAVTLSAAVDAVVVVAKLKRLRRPALEAVARLLGRVDTPVLGVVVTGADARRLEGFPYARTEGGAGRGVPSASLPNDAGAVRVPR